MAPIGHECKASSRRTSVDPVYVEVALRRWERFSGQAAARLDG
jgi:hypothetical protein